MWAIGGCEHRFGVSGSIRPRCEKYFAKSLGVGGPHRANFSFFEDFFKIFDRYTGFEATETFKKQTQFYEKVAARLSSD